MRKGEFRNKKNSYLFFIQGRFNFGIFVRVVNLVREIPGVVKVREERKAFNFGKEREADESTMRETHNGKRRERENLKKLSPLYLLQVNFSVSSSNGELLTS